MSSALVSASLGNARILPCKSVAVRSGGHHDELRPGEKWTHIGLSVVRLLRAKLANLRVLLSGSPKMGPTPTARGKEN